MPFYQKHDVRIRYEEAGSGFPLLVTPGGGLNSRVSNWPTAVFNSMEVFKNDFRCITMDQRNANGGESTGPIAVDDPWGAFADDQLGLMDHLGIREFFFMGYCIGGCFALKLMERAPDRVVAGVICQTVGHRPENPDVMYNSGRDVWAPGTACSATRPDHVHDRGLSAQPVPRPARLRVQRVARFRAFLPDANARAAGRHPLPPVSDFRGCRSAGAASQFDSLSLARAR
jgi:pimeloyl-ACP methyl ester carboxylesterase